MKIGGFYNWDFSNENPSNSSGFSAIAAGYIAIYGTNVYVHFELRYGRFWSSTQGDLSTQAWHLLLSYDSDDANLFLHDKVSGFSVRCIKD